MHRSIIQHQDSIAELCRRFDVRRLEAFGSAARGADFESSHSDVDFMVEFGSDRTMDPLQQFFGLAFALEEMLGRRVDLVENGAIENPYLLASVKRDLETVYEP